MIQFTTEVDLRGATLIIPSVSVGNIGQLTTDLLISTFECSKIGFIWHKAVMAVIGADPYSDSNSKPMTASEIYYCESKNLAFLQIRSPILTGGIVGFLKNLTEWVQSSGVSRVVILSGSTYNEGNINLIAGNKLRYIFSPKLKAESDDMLSALSWTPHEMANGRYYLPGCGFALLLYEKLLTNNVNVGLLVKFCSEGDNIPDAYALADFLDGMLGYNEGDAVKNVQWVQPKSWKHLFGKLASKSIYGR